MSTRYLTESEILFIHKTSLIRYGGTPGIRDHGALRSAIRRPQTTIEQEDAFPTLELKAATYVDSFARNHPFLDGNKRTAYISAGRFLQLNSRYLQAPVDEAEKFVLEVITGHMAIKDIAAWLDDHCDNSQQGDSAESLRLSVKPVPNLPCPDSCHWPGTLGQVLSRVEDRAQARRRRCS
jgi:death on curing protein